MRGRSRLYALAHNQCAVDEDALRARVARFDLVQQVSRSEAPYPKSTDLHSETLCIELI